jgi:hypothetical protein
VRTLEVCKHCLTAIVALVLFARCPGLLHGQTIAVPNGSFESPATTFVSVNIDFWQKTPQPFDYVDTLYSWTQLTGIFMNQPTNDPSHIDNCDGNQALWLWADPEVGIFQDYNSMGSTDAVPTHAFDVKFEVAKSYHLTVGVIGGGGNMPQGATLDLSLYYRDSASNPMPVAVTTVTNSTDIFSNTTHLIDFEVNVPTVHAGDPWAGQNIGIQFLSTVDTNLQGGYWDLDNVRLLAGPALLNPGWTNGQFQFTLRSEAGLGFEILASPNPTLPISSWSSLGKLTNATGTITFTDTTANSSRRSYRARQFP